MRPEGPRPAPGRPVDLRGPRPASPPGPLAARTDLLEAPRPRAYAPHPSPSGRVRRFVRQYGWRAYAVPLLTVATIAALVDLALPGNDATSPPAGGMTAATVASPSLPVPDGDTVPPAQGDAEPTGQAPATGPQPYVERGAGTVTVVDGSSPVYGSGPLRRFVVEVEDGIDVDGTGFAQAVEQTLADPRSWGHDGQMAFQRVGAAEAASGQYEFRVSLVSPGSMEIYCPGVGTGGYTSCRYGERAVINLARWATAVPDYQGDVATYRQYVVNHEVGHALGNGHEDCPGAGRLAPVMQQQTLGLHGCVKSAWPYP